MRTIRIASVVAAICGNAVHIHFGAMTIVGGWPAFISQFKKGFELTACLACTVFFDVFMYVVWFGCPFYLLGIAAFTTRSVPVIIGSLLSVVSLVCLDAVWYYSGNSRDWYVVLSPVALGGIALVGFLVLLFAGRAGRGASGVQTSARP
jgi:hypothetical protein